MILNEARSQQILCNNLEIENYINQKRKNDHRSYIVDSVSSSPDRLINSTNQNQYVHCVDTLRRYVICV